jgi:hypothetical protein
VLDVKLPHLEKVLDPETVLHRFKEAYGAWLSEKKLTPEKCAIERIQHKKNKRCRILFRITMSKENGRQIDQWFFGKLVKSGQARHQFEEALASDHLANGEWPAVILWNDWDFIVWAFPNDPEMPGLRIAADPDVVRGYLSENMAKFGLNLDWRCEKVAIDRVKYMPGKRCVLRMNAELKNGKGERKNLAFFSKTYPDRNSLSHYRIVNVVYQQFSHLVHIPRPVLYMDGANSFWQEQWPGRPLADLLHYANWDALFTHLGEVVANFHKNDMSDLPRKFDIETVLFDAREDAKMLGWLLPEFRAQLDFALEAMMTTKDSVLSQRIPKVPIHGALRVEQFMARDNDIALLDFDAASLGDPLFDVVEFITSLQYMAITQGYSRQKIARAIGNFEQSYFRAAPWEPQELRMAWYAVAFTITKIYDSVKNLDRPALNLLDSSIGHLENWLGIILKNATQTKANLKDANNGFASVFFKHPPRVPV